jgi:NDP-sugar pyrophosphorylase family protein
VLPALVLTAGLGTRLDPITRLVAKAAVPIGESTLIERVLADLADQGVTDVVLNLHHRPDTITSVVGDGSHLGLRVRYSWEPVLLGSAGGPRHALPLLDSPTFLIVNGDTHCRVDLQSLIAEHARTQAAVTMAVVPNPAPAAYNGLDVDADGRVTGIKARGHADGTWHVVGVQVVQASVFEALPDDVPAETVHGIYQSLLGAPAGGGWRCHRVNSAFVDVGTPADYLNAALALGGASAVSPGAAIARGATITRTVVWPGATIGPHASLDECIVTNVAVPAGFRARCAVLVPSSVRQPTDAVPEHAGVLVFPIDR